MNPLGNLFIVFAAVYVGKMADAQSNANAIMQGVIAKQNAFHAQHRQNEQGLLAQQVQNQNNLIRNNWGLGRPSNSQQNTSPQGSPPQSNPQQNSPQQPGPQSSPEVITPQNTPVISGVYQNKVFSGVSL
jgi:hypothetical protein